MGQNYLGMMAKTGLLIYFNDQRLTRRPRLHQVG